MYKSFFSLLIVVLVEAISVAIAALKDYVIRHRNSDDGDTFDNYAFA
jgi:hypothetical protein